jgi:hypothetical protein
VKLPFTANTPYINTIHHTDQVKFPGNREMERRIKNIVRWNAMAMVVRANQVLRRRSAVTFQRSPRLQLCMKWLRITSSMLARQITPATWCISRAMRRPECILARFSKDVISEDQLMNFRRELAGGHSVFPAIRIPG